MKDIFLQNWASQINNDSLNENRTVGNKLRTYRTIKTNYIYEPYLDKIGDVEKRRTLTKFRGSNHKLKIETGRYLGLPADQRKFTFCHLDEVDDECHFLSRCSFHNQERTTLETDIGYDPSTLELKTLLNKTDDKSILAVATYISTCFRNRYENNQDA